MVDSDDGGAGLSDPLFSIADRFKPGGRIVDIREFGNGNVNDTFLVGLDCGTEAAFVLQRINTQVFCRPELVMANMRAVTEHLSRRLEREPLPDGRRWEVPRVFPTRDGADHWVDSGGSFWRAMRFIGESHSFDTVQGSDHAREVGLALGLFQSLISDLPPDRLADTLEGFHITPRYLLHYDEVLPQSTRIGSPETDYAVRFVAGRRSRVHVLEEAKRAGRLPLRPIHGDPKVNNILIDNATCKAVSIVDLDTVKPGLIHYDIGDCLRSSCNPLGEETERWESVRFEPDLCEAILRGYLPWAKGFLTPNDYGCLFDAIPLVAFELGLRFFTDYLEGDVYFKARYPEHNLARALVQFKLTESIEAQADAIRSLIRDLAGK